jgi:hypothetical protein
MRKARSSVKAHKIPSAKQRAKKTKAMLAEVAELAVADAFNKACPIANKIGSPRGAYDLLRGLHSAIRNELEAREALIQ